MSLKVKSLIFSLLFIGLSLKAGFAFGQKVEIIYPNLPSFFNADSPNVISEKIKNNEIEKDKAFPLYIKYFYGLAIMLSGFITLVVIVYGGFKYVISSGNPASLSAAREWISGGVIGLLLILSIHIILITLNPNLIMLGLSAPAIEKCDCSSASLSPYCQVQCKTPPQVEETKEYWAEIPTGRLIERVLKKSEEARDVAKKTLEVANRLKEATAELQSLLLECGCRVSNCDSSGCSFISCGSPVPAGKPIRPCPDWDRIDALLNTHCTNPDPSAPPPAYTSFPFGCFYYYSTNPNDPTDCSCMNPDPIEGKITCRGEHGGCCPMHGFWGVCGVTDCQGIGGGRCPEYPGHDCPETWLIGGPSLEPVCTVGIIPGLIGELSYWRGKTISAYNALRKEYIYLKAAEGMVKNTNFLESYLNFNNYKEDLTYIEEVKLNPWKDIDLKKSPLTGQIESEDPATFYVLKDEIAEMFDAIEHSTFESDNPYVQPPGGPAPPPPGGSDCNFCEIPLHYTNAVPTTEIRDHFASLFPNSKINSDCDGMMCWDYVIQEAKKMGWNPVVLLALWGEESAFSQSDAWDLGIVGYSGGSDIIPQMQGFKEIADSYSDWCTNTEDHCGTDFCCFMKFWAGGPSCSFYTPDDNSKFYSNFYSFYTQLAPTSDLSAAPSGECSPYGHGRTILAIPALLQNDPNWASVPMNTCSFTLGTYSPPCTNKTGCGCGPTSLAMILRYFGQDVYPGDMGIGKGLAEQLLNGSGGGVRCDQPGSYYGELAELAKNTYGISYTIYGGGTNFDTLQGEIRNGHPIMASCDCWGEGCWDHISVIKGIEDGYVYFQDTILGEKVFTVEDVQNNFACEAFYAFSPPSSPPPSQPPAEGFIQLGCSEPNPPGTNKDYNIGLLRYHAVDPTFKDFVCIDHPQDPTDPPKFQSILGRIPEIANVYAANDENYSYPVHLIGFRTTSREDIRVPSSGYPHIDQGYDVTVIYADDNSIALRYAKSDHVSYLPDIGTYGGYTVYIKDIDINDNLWQGVNFNCLNGTKNLPGLSAGNTIGKARGSEIVVAIRDTGSLMDPRWIPDWWRGSGLSCP